MRSALAALALCSGAALSIGTANAADVLVVRSEDSLPVLEAQRAIVEGLALRGASARTVGMEELEDDAPGMERIWLAIGDDAAVRVHALRRPDISIAHCLVSDPAYVGLDPFDFPGVACRAPLASQLRLIQEILPEAKVIGVLVRSGSEEGRARVEELTESLPEGWTVETVVVSPEVPFGSAVQDLLERPIDLVWTFPDQALYDSAMMKSFLLACLRKRKPVYGYSQEVVQAGALFGIAMDSQAQGRAAADLVLNLLTHPGMGPSAVRGFLDPSAAAGTIAVNLSVAQVLRREISQSLVSRAKYVVYP